MSIIHTGLKTEYNMKWPFKVIQGHVFGGQWKANGVYTLPYNNFGLISKGFKDIATESTENRRAHSFSALSPSIPSELPET